MTAPTSQITFALVALDGYATLGLRVRYEDFGGFGTLRMSDGSAVRQQFWTKKRITLTANGWAPTALKALDYNQTFTLTVPDPEDAVDGLVDYTVFAQITEEHDINGAAVSWTLVCEES